MWRKWIPQCVPDISYFIPFTTIVLLPTSNDFFMTCSICMYATAAAFVVWYKWACFVFALLLHHRLLLLFIICISHNDNKIIFIFRYEVKCFVSCSFLYVMLCWPCYFPSIFTTHALRCLATCYGIKIRNFMEVIGADILWASGAYCLVL